MILQAAMMTILFLGGWLADHSRWLTFTWIPGPIWFIAKIIFVLFFFIWVRATFPRFRYDQLMRSGVEGVPAACRWFWLVLTAGVLVFMGWLPHSA